MNVQLEDAGNKKTNKKIDKMLLLRKKRIKKALIITAIVLGVLVVCCVVSAFVFKVNKITYEGCEKYTEEELTHKIFGTDSPNALFYTLSGKKNPDIPFIQKVDVEVIWPDKMNVTIYEKAVVGYVDYMGSIMYFDKDGIVVESSSVCYDGVPQIQGLEFKSIVLNSKLEVGDEVIFDYILNVTQALDKYNLDVDTVYFDKEYRLTIYYGDVKVIIGDSHNSIERLHVLKQVSDKLEGLSGTLDLSNYNGDESSIVLKKELKNY